MLSFPSIKPFNAAIKAVAEKTSYVGKDEHGESIYSRGARPILTYIGTVKLHGSNSSIVQYQSGEMFKIQSRNREINIENDNMGFAKFIEESGAEYWLNMFSQIRTKFKISDTDAVSIYGEICGSSVQKGVALSQLPKMFVIFAIGIGGKSVVEKELSDDIEDDIDVNEENQNRKWIASTLMNSICVDHNKGIYNSFQLPSFEITIDFNNPIAIQNLLIDLTNQVETECPVGKHFGVSGIGEGIVWRPTHPDYQSSRFWFKVKGKKHSVTKVKTLVEVDLEKMNSIDEFARAVLSNARLQQAIEYLQESGLKVSVESTSSFLKWICNDVIKEESDRMKESCLSKKEVFKAISDKARCWYFKYLDN
jgi:hypothetical protein